MKDAGIFSLVHHKAAERGFHIDDVAPGSPATMMLLDEKSPYCRACHRRVAHVANHEEGHRRGDFTFSADVEVISGIPTKHLVVAPRHMVPMGPCTVIDVKRSSSGRIHSIRARLEWFPRERLIRFCPWRQDGFYHVQGCSGPGSNSFPWVLLVGEREHRDEILQDESDTVARAFSMETSHQNIDYFIGGRS